MLDAPLLAAWHRFAGGSSTPFTIPGHKRRGGLIDDGLAALLSGDVPLFAGLGPIRSAPAVVARAEALGADLWQADWCRYSTGGSTHANQVVALACGAPGDTVLVSRTAHRSTLLGIVLAGLRPVWLPAEIDPRFQIPAGHSVSVVSDALEANPGCAGLFLVEPSYLGTTSDVGALVALAHAHDVPVVVDQAWGAHFGFHPSYPRHALQHGADAMVFSAHKTLPAYTQGSVVAARTERLDRDRLERAFEACATTSPSGTVLASVDACRALLADPLGASLLDRLVGLASDARDRLASLGAVVPEPSDFAAGRFDPAKLVLLLARAGLSGIAIEDALVAGGTPVELADRDTLVPILSVADDAQTVEVLIEAVLRAADGMPREPREPAASSSWDHEIPPSPLTPREAFFATRETVPADQAIDRISAEVIAPYPPGVPVLVPGELVTANALASLQSATDAGVRIAYAADPTLRTLQVVA